MTCHYFLGFPLYATLANGIGIETKEYNLLPEKNWEVSKLFLCIAICNIY